MMGLPGTYNEQNASSRQAGSQPAARAMTAVRKWSGRHRAAASFTE
jgi:hypothetical protein